MNQFIDCVNFSKLIVFSQAAHLVASLDQSQREALHDNELELLRQVDIIDVFVNELVINCVNFCKTDFI